MDKSIHIIQICLKALKSTGISTSLTLASVCIYSRQCPRKPTAIHFWCTIKHQPLYFDHIKATNSWTLEDFRTVYISGCIPASPKSHHHHHHHHHHVACPVDVAVFTSDLHDSCARWQAVARPMLSGVTSDSTLRTAVTCAKRSSRETECHIIPESVGVPACNICATITAVIRQYQYPVICTDVNESVYDTHTYLVN